MGDLRLTVGDWQSWDFLGNGGIGALDVVVIVPDEVAEFLVWLALRVEGYQIRGHTGLASGGVLAFHSVVEECLEEIPSRPLCLPLSARVLPRYCRGRARHFDSCPSSTASRPV